MRLIDADELYDKLADRLTWLMWYVDEVYLTVGNTIRSVMDEQKTAYDTDKVVEQLEELGQKMSESKSIQKYGKSSPANHRYYKAVSVKRAIEIVKGGGVNE